MLKKVFLVILVAVFTVSFVQAQSDLTYKSGVIQDGTRLTPDKVRELMSGNSEALTTYNNGMALGTVGTIFGGIGGGLIGWDLGTRLGGGQGNGKLLAVGAVSTGVGLVFALISEANLKKSVTLYNSKLSNNTISYQVNFGFTQTGVGLSMRF